MPLDYSRPFAPEEIGRMTEEETHEAIRALHTADEGRRQLESTIAMAVIFGQAPEAEAAEHMAQIADKWSEVESQRALLFRHLAALAASPEARSEAAAPEAPAAEPQALAARLPRLGFHP